MSVRQLGDWLTGYLEYTDSTEPPISYHTWCGISAIAGALQRKVRLSWGHETLYPNLYVVLVGPSGRCRKGTAMMMAMDIVKEADIPLTAENVTREALIKRIEEARASYVDATTNQLTYHSSITCLSEELSVFLGQGDIRFLSTLTNWYDSRDIWRYETKGSGTFEIQGICFNFLGGTAPDWMPSMLPQEAIGGGFTSRIIFIVEADKRQVVPEHKLSPRESELRDALIHDLQIIKNISGEYLFEKEARAAYVAWYRETERARSNGSSPIPDPRFSGYLDRRATHVRKLSMVMSASRTSRKIISVADFQRGLKILEAAEKKMSQAFGGVGRSNYSEAVEKVMALLQHRGTVLRSELLMLMHHDVDTQTLPVVEEVLRQMHVLDIELMPTRNDVKYKWTGPR